MNSISHNATLAQKRKRRVRGKISGTAERPRLSVTRSNKYMYLQLIDDTAGKTIAASSDVAARKAKKAGTKTESAQAAAKALFEQMKKQKVDAVVFDRGSYRYHGRVKSVVEELRQLGVKV